MSETQAPELSPAPSTADTAAPAAPVAAKAAKAATPKRAVKPAAKKAAAAKAPAAEKVPAAAPAPAAQAEVKPEVQPAAEAVAAEPQPKAQKPAKAAPEAESKGKKASAKKPKLVRDSFTFPETDYALLAKLKQRALASGCEIKKSELVRAGLALLDSLAADDLAKALGAVERIKTGRPKK